MYCFRARIVKRRFSGRRASAKRLKPLRPWRASVRRRNFVVRRPRVPAAETWTSPLQGVRMGLRTCRARRGGLFRKQKIPSQPFGGNGSSDRVKDFVAISCNTSAWSQLPFGGNGSSDMSYTDSKFVQLCRESQLPFGGNGSSDERHQYHIQPPPPRGRNCLSAGTGLPTSKPLF